MKKQILKQLRNKNGSLALEHVLFIAALVLISGAIFGFYGRLETFFNSIDIEDAGSWSTSGTNASGSGPN